MVLSAAAAGAIEQDVMNHAAEFTEHTWFSSTANQTADCSAPYNSVSTWRRGVGGPQRTAYDWGGWDTILFDQKIADGYGAGTHADDGVLSCTTGQDCSGFISVLETSKSTDVDSHQVTTQLGSPTKSSRVTP